MDLRSGILEMLRNCIGKVKNILRKLAKKRGKRLIKRGCKCIRKWLKEFKVLSLKLILKKELIIQRLKESLHLVLAIYLALEAGV